MKKVFIIHGWGFSPKNKLYKWLAEQCKDNGFEVFMPEMPNTEEPEINAWVGKLKDIAENIDKNTFFIGHSIGCQTILRFLETLPEKTKVGGAVFIAPWTNLTGMEDEEGAQEIAAPWINTPLDWTKIKKHTSNFTCIFSDNDAYVPLSEIKVFQKNLGARTITEENKGHFTEEDKVMKIPSVIKELMAMS